MLEEDEQLRLAREVMLHGPQARPNSKLSREREKDKSEADVFKVPPLPPSLSQLQDVFGAVNPVKEKEGSSELEKANKTVRPPVLSGRRRTKAKVVPL